MAQTDEGHIRDALAEFYQWAGWVTYNLAACNPPILGKEGNLDAVAFLEKAKAHIDAIRVRGDSKRKARADGAAE